MTIISLLDMLGTLVFAISGWYTATAKKLDYFGAAMIALVTAIGGGSLRDVLIGNTPVSWMKNPNISYYVVLGIVLAIIGGKYLRRLRKTLFLFDTLGLALFSILGTKVALQYDVAPFTAILLGVGSATAGGIIRDTLCNEIPLIFREELYATPCIIGATAYFLLSQYTPIDESICTLIGFAIVAFIRIMAVWRNWKMPLARS